MEMAKLTELQEKDLKTAEKYSNWSFVGIIIPLVGWIFGSFSIKMMNTLPTPTNVMSRAYFRGIKSKAWWGIILSTLSFALAIGLKGYTAYQSNQSEMQQEQVQTQQDSAGAEEMRKIRAQNGLNNCLDNAYKTYEEGFKDESKKLGRTDGLLPEANVERWDERYKESKDECYRQFDAGLFDTYILFAQ